MKCHLWDCSSSSHCRGAAFSTQLEWWDSLKALQKEGNTPTLYSTKKTWPNTSPISYKYLVHTSSNTICLYREASPARLGRGCEPFSKVCEKQTDYQELKFSLWQSTTFTGRWWQGFFLRNSKILKGKNLGCLASLYQNSTNQLVQKPKFMKHTHSSCFEHPGKHYLSFLFFFFKSIVSRYSKTETKNSNFHNIPWFCNKFHQLF